MSDIAALVADNLDVWIGAIERKSGTGRGGGGKRISLYGIERLRALILDLAVRGKLLPQDPADGHAAELLKQIDKARLRLVEGGYIARSKTQIDLTGPAAPFVIPATWAWVRLERLGAIVGGGTPPSTDESCFTDSGDGTPWLTPADLSGFAGKYIERGSRDLTDRGLGSSSAKVMPKGTVLFTSRAPIGYVAISANPISTNQGFKSVVPSIDGLSEFIAMVLGAFAEAIDENAPGTTFKEVSGKIVSAIAFPLPPLAEQHRIVAKVDELMALCDALERESADTLAAHQVLVETLLATLVNSADAADLAANWARLERHFDTLFTTEASIDALKQTILDLAVRGKLVEQDERDEDASILLKRIQIERVKLIGGKRASKVLASPKVETKLPSGWICSPLAGTGLTMTGGTPKSSEPENFAGLVPFIGPGQISQDGDILPAEKFISELGLAQSTEALPGDILMVCIGGSIGKSAIARARMAYNQQINAIRPIMAASRYIDLYLRSLNFQIAVIERATGSATPIINRSKWEEIPVALPPLAEQHRIVAKVDELMALCDALKVRLADAAETRRHLADAIVERVAA